MNILEKIILYKRKEVAQNKNLTPIADLEKSAFFEKKTYSALESLRKEYSSCIIAEFKRRSPSKNMINNTVLPGVVAKGYQEAGVAVMSILTDSEFFGGSYQDLQKARLEITLPILRKDFIIDKYQIIEAKSMGADVILLIAAVLSPKEVKDLAVFAKTLGLEVLLEVHNLEELEQNLHQEIDMIGVNNRNLKTFEVSIENSLRLVEKIPAEFLKVSESGISQISTILQLQESGFQGFLIGENFMKTSNPSHAAQEFIQELQSRKISR